MRKLAYVVVAAVLPAAFLALALIGYDYYGRERARLIRDSLSTTRALAAAVDTEFAVVRSALLALATSSRLREDDFGGLHAEGLELIRDLKAGSQESLVLINLTDRNGAQRLNTLRRFGEPLPAGGVGAGLVPRIFESGAPAVSNLFRSQVFAGHVIGVGVPVRRDGAVRHALNAGISPGRFSALLEREHLPEGWVASILDASGTIVARTRDEARLVGQKGSSELVRRMEETREEVFDGRTVEGISVLTAFSRAPSSGYVVAIGISQRALALELASSIGRLFFAGFTALLIAVGVTLVLGGRFARPGIVLIVAAIVPAAFLAIGLVGYDYHVRERDRLVRDSLSTTRALAAAVDTEFDVVKAAMIALATSRRLATGDLGGFHARALEAAQQQDSFINIIVTDASGRQLLNTFRPFGAPLPAGGDPGDLARTFKTGAPVISNLFEGRVMQRHVMGVGIPVKREGAVRYSLNAGVSPSHFSKLLKEQRLPEGWVAGVLDASGTIVARTHDEARLIGAKGAPGLVRRAREAAEGAFGTLTVEGIPVLTVFSRAPASGYTVAIGIPERDLTLSLAQSIGKLFFAGFLALLTAIVAALLLARRSLRTPLR